MKRSTLTILCSLVLLGSHALQAHAQSLFLAQDTSTQDANQPAMLLEDISIYFIEAPETRTIQEHDIITIIIDENSSQISSQKLETEKDSKSKATVNAMVDLLQLLELRVRQGNTPSGTNIVDFTSKREFSGEGDYERKDRFSARIAAVVLEVKPNGTLVLQATKRIAKDKEVSVLVLSGLARDEDVTAENTILSSQLADLNIILENEGDLKKASEKGLITRVLDTVFAF